MTISELIESLDHEVASLIEENARLREQAETSWKELMQYKVLFPMPKPQPVPVPEAVARWRGCPDRGGMPWSDYVGCMSAIVKHLWPTGEQK